MALGNEYALGCSASLRLENAETDIIKISCSNIVLIQEAGCL